MSTPLNQLVTILVMTHNNQHYLPRVFSYYGEHADCLLINDSSDEAYNGPMPEGCRYRHFPGHFYAHKTHLALQNVWTPYALLCGVDDFVVPEALAHCVYFLEQHPDHSSAQGRFIHFNPVNKRYVPLYLLSFHMRVVSDDPCKRIKEQILPYMNQNYAVHNTLFLQEFFEEASRLVPRTLFLEMALSIAAAIEGKHGLLDVLYCAREWTPSSNGRTKPSLQHMTIDPEYKPFYDGFLQMLARRLAAKSGLDPEIARQHIQSTLELFLNVFRPMMTQSKHSESLSTYMGRLEPQAINHFSRLRRIIRQFGYPPKEQVCVTQLTS